VPRNRRLGPPDNRDGPFRGLDSHPTSHRPCQILLLRHPRLELGHDLHQGIGGGDAASHQGHIPVALLSIRHHLPPGLILHRQHGLSLQRLPPARHLVGPLDPGWILYQRLVGSHSIIHRILHKHAHRYPAVPLAHRLSAQAQPATG